MRQTIMHLQVRGTLALLPVLLLLAGCNRNNIHARDSVTADVITHASVALGSKLTGKLYLSDGQLRIDWGEFADVFDLAKRTGCVFAPLPRCTWT
jgi:hypothetical protein